MKITEFSNEEVCRLWLACGIAIGSKRMRALLKTFGSALGAFQYIRSIIFAEKAPTKLLTQHEIQRLQLESPKAMFQRVSPALKTLDVEIIFPDSESYPTSLYDMTDYPNVLFIRGKLPMPHVPKVAVIGSRNCPPSGIKAASQAARELSKRGACIVSGLAYGADAYAHTAALQYGTAECPTIAVLSGGIESPYPAGNGRLFSSIAERGALVSEFQVHAHPVKGSFPIRNKVIAALSSSVVVACATTRSGALTTAEYARSIGRTVFCPHYPAEDTAISNGTKRLLSEGKAIVIETYNDILRSGITPPKEGSMRIKASSKKRGVISSPPPHTPLPQKTDSSPILDESERIIYDLLRISPLSFDEIIQKTGFSVSSLNFVLTSLEFSGIIKQSHGRQYDLSV